MRRVRSHESLDPGPHRRETRVQGQQIVKRGGNGLTGRNTHERSIGPVRCGLVSCRGSQDKTIPAPWLPGKQPKQKAWNVFLSL
ncbi:hypothetical protein GCM10008955_18790 [Deinococcus malanensis]|uniref:Uncharacterized protein n=1 Tax=Deinococcus malanensis TaxID=1706855 RepID=A0ABQ2EXA3_9DEIO|nr:hypothetical protein GCM10008955_18790 [Deinococcus malanensis]